MILCRDAMLSCIYMVQGLNTSEKVSRFEEVGVGDVCLTNGPCVLTCWGVKCLKHRHRLETSHARPVETD